VIRQKRLLLVEHYLSDGQQPNTQVQCGLLLLSDDAARFCRLLLKISRRLFDSF